MTRSPETTTFGTLLADESRAHPDFYAEWRRTALARAVAARLIEYRAKNRLSQRALADKLGVKQPFVAKLEMGETNPQIETLINLSERLGIEFMIDIAPAAKAPKLVTRRAREAARTITAPAGRASVTVATA
jgi:ribosome-binding protein aMBF1 (putative translation factor)